MERKPAMHPEDIKAAVRKTGITLTALSLANGLAECTCRASLTRAVPAGNRAIAEHLGRKLSDLWPQWYDAEGHRLRSNSKGDDTIRDYSGHRQKRAAK
ncbi:MAG: transcriptional regulator [Rhodospirillaceae bacterium]